MLPRIEVDFEMITGETHWRHIPIDMALNAQFSDVLKPDMRVILYAKDDLEAEGDIEFDSESNVWYGIPDWSTVYYYRLSVSPHQPDTSDQLPHIIVDFNTIMTDPRQRVRIFPLDILEPDMRVMLVEVSDFEVEGVVIYDEQYQSWYGLPDWSTVHYYDDE